MYTFESWHSRDSLPRMGGACFARSDELRSDLGVDTRHDNWIYRLTGGGSFLAKPLEETESPFEASRD